MHIDIGDSFIVYPKMKKSFVEETYYENEHGHECIQEVGWRTGSVKVIVETKEQAQLLMDCHIDNEDFDADDFGDYEFIESSDGCWEQTQSVSLPESEVFAEWEEMDDEQKSYFFDKWCWLEEEKGWEQSKYKILIFDGVELERE